MPDYNEQDVDPAVLRDALVQKGMEEIWRNLGSKPYYVYSGAVNWAAFSFETHPRAVGLLILDQGFLKDINPATISFEVFTKMPPRKEGVEGIDPVVQSEMKRDIRTAMARLRQATVPNTNNEPLIFRYLVGSDNMQDVSDSENKLQGVIATLRVEY